MLPEDDESITDGLWAAIGYAAAISSVGTAAFVGMLWWVLD